MPEATVPALRESIFDPPSTYVESGRPPISRAMLWNGDRIWIVTGYGAMKQVTTDPRLSAVPQQGYPSISASRAVADELQASFIRMDDPDHARHRQTVAKYFTARAVEQLRPAVVGITTELLDAMEQHSRPRDLVEALAYDVPTWTMCHMLGVPQTDRQFLLEATHVRMALSSAPEQVRAVDADVISYFRRLLSAKRADPDGSLLSDLVREQVEPGHLSEDELIGIARLLQGGGFDTTANMIAVGTLLLLEREDVKAELLADASRIPDAVDEMLRYLSVVQFTPRRVALEDVEIAGAKIRKGDGIVVLPGAANRDPSAFEDPDSFDIHRRARHHLAFGYGPHACLGLALARLELQVVFTHLLARFPDLRVAEAPDAVQVHDGAVFGLSRLLVTW